MASVSSQYVVEITILSVENLKRPSFTLFSQNWGPFISISVTNADNPRPPPPPGTKSDDRNVNTTVRDSFLVPIQATFFVNTQSRISLQLHTKRFFGRRAQLGQCSILPADIGAPPVGSVRHLSYKLRSNDGSKSKGDVTINLKVKLECYGSLPPPGQEVVGIPIKHTEFAYLVNNFAQVG